MRVSVFLATFGFCVPLLVHAEDLRRGDLLIAAQDGKVVFNGVSHSFVKFDYFVDQYDGSGIFRSRVLSGPPHPSDFQAQGLMSGNGTILFAENQHSLRRIRHDGTPGDSFGSLFTWAIAMVADGAGSVFVADHQWHDYGEVLKHDGNGTVVDRYPIDVWFSMDLAADRCTLVYPEIHLRLIGGDYFDTWLSISRYDLCRRTPLPDLISRWPKIAMMHLRILPDDGFLLLAEDEVFRLDAKGNQVWRKSEDGFNPFTLSLDTTGSEFWATSRDGSLSRYSVESGNRVLGPIAMNSDRLPLALTVVGEWRAARDGDRTDRGNVRDRMP